MRQFALRSRVPASVSDAWSTLTLRVQRADGKASSLKPAVVSVIRPNEIVLLVSVRRLRLLEMEHVFRLEPLGSNECILHQSWTVRGPLATALWPLLRSRMARYEQLGVDLADALSAE